MVRVLDKIRKQANQIANQEDINDGSKMKMIKKLYAKEKTQF